MPIYEYTCTACRHTTEILHGIHEEGPHFCPECGTEGAMRKGFAPPAIVFKGSGWAKKDRSSGQRTKAAAKDEGSPEKAKPAAEDSGASSSGSGSTSGSGSPSGSGSDAGSSGG